MIPSESQLAGKREIFSLRSPFVRAVREPPLRVLALAGLSYGPGRGKGLSGFPHNIDNWFLMLKNLITSIAKFYFSSLEAVAVDSLFDP